MKEVTVDLDAALHLPVFLCSSSQLMWNLVTLGLDAKIFL